MRSLPGYSQLAFPQSMCGEEESSLMCLLIRTLILLDQGSTIMTSFNLSYFLTPNTATLGLRASTYEFLGDTTIKSIMLPNKLQQPCSLKHTCLLPHSSLGQTYRQAPLDCLFRALQGWNQDVVGLCSHLEAVGKHLLSGSFRLLAEFRYLWMKNRSFTFFLAVVWEHFSAPEEPLYSLACPHSVFKARNHSSVSNVLLPLLLPARENSLLLKASCD